MNAKTRGGALVGLGIVVGAIIGTFLWGGLDGAAIESFVEDLGIWGPVAFVALMWLIQPFGLPGAVFMVPAGVLWPLPLAIALAWLGNMGASSLAFGFSRWFGRDWVQPRIPAKVRRFDERLDAGGIREVVVLRLITGQFPPADWLLGVSSVRWRPFLTGTALGITPGIVLFVAGGGGLVRLISGG